MNIRTEYEVLRSPDRQPKCYDMTEQERQSAIIKLSNLDKLITLQTKSDNEKNN